MERDSQFTPILIFTAADSKNRFAEIHLFSFVQNLFSRYGNGGFSGRYVVRIMYKGRGDWKVLDSLHFPSR